MSIFKLTCFFFFSFLPLIATELQIIEKKLHINGKEASVYAVVQSDGRYGIKLKKGELFDILLKNNLNVPASLHWHGLILPNNQDGVAFITQFPIYPSLSYHYRFPLIQSGTYWMHSHVGLQEQTLLSAPLIIQDPEDSNLADQETILFLADFSFTPPSKIMEGLRCNNHKNNPMAEHDIVEIKYDAFLTNYKTLENPEIIEVKPNSTVRLRIINGSSATNFFIHLGNLKGKAIAVDGNRIKELIGTKFELAVAQRMDILVKIPETGGSFPILAQGEGTDRQTGLILSTRGASIPQVSEKAIETAGPLTNVQESHLEAMDPLSSKPIDNQLIVEIGGNMKPYVWTINNQTWPESTPLVVKKGQRVEIVFKNNSKMSHPMHLHGHVFQVKSINGKKIEGAMRDTVLVMPDSTISIQFDANNPGVWPLHCHILYHMEAGMLTVLRYSDYEQPL